MTEQRKCQNCKQSFTIDPEDFDFYKKMAVPPPTWCPDCRLMRRYAWRNERTLWKAVCDHCKKQILSGYPPEGGFTIYCHDCWVSDVWDPMDYGREYDFNKPFFVQWAELAKRAPRMNLYQLNCINSPYINIAGDSKDCYLAFSLVKCEETFYSKNIDRSRQIFDSINCTDSERCYWNINAHKNFEVNFSIITRECVSSSFLFDCRNCSNCFMSSGLRSKEYVFRNKQYTREEYMQKLNEVRSSSYSDFRNLLVEFNNLYRNALHRFVWTNKTVNSSGDMLLNVKNTKHCFEVYDMEDVAYAGRAFGLKDAMDVNNTITSELIYEYTSGGRDSRNLRFSIGSFSSENNNTYTGWCSSSSNLFGCFGLKNKQYCILNRQYTKEEYEALVPKVIKHMNEMPYEGKNGRVYRFGEFYPIELSPFPYNGSVAQEHFTFTKEEILEKGFHYREPDIKNPQIDIQNGQIPDDIKDVGDDITGKSLECEHSGKCLHQCTIAFRVVPAELAMYRRIKFPLPRLCPNCRHYTRLEYRNPWKLWSGKCSKCSADFQTSYSPEKQKDYKIYCEACYNAEIA